MRYFLFTIIFIVNTQATYAQAVNIQQRDTIIHVNPPPMIMHSSGNPPYLYQYEPEVIKSLDELPVGTVSKVETYLKNRVGKTYHETFKFAGGQKINLTNEDSLRLRVKDYRWKLATYYLRFTCTTIKEPSVYFEAGASFDSSGSVIDSINLPHQTGQIDKFKLISMARATQIAKSKWPLMKDKSWINNETLFLDYSPLNNSFTWWFSKSTSEHPGKSRLRRIFIDANTGAVLRIRDNTHRYIPF